MTGPAFGRRKPGAGKHTKGRHTMRRMPKEMIGQEGTGKVLAYNRGSGYGYIFTKDGDLFLSSYSLKGIEDKIHVGTLLGFLVGEHKGNPCAVDIRVIEEFRNRKILLQNGEEIETDQVLKFGIANAWKAKYKNEKLLEYARENHFTEEDLLYFYLDTRKTTYWFFTKWVPYESNGLVQDVKDYYEYIRKDVFGIDMPD